MAVRRAVHAAVRPWVNPLCCLYCTLAVRKLAEIEPISRARKTVPRGGEIVNFVIAVRLTIGIDDVAGHLNLFVRLPNGMLSAPNVVDASEISSLFDQARWL